MHFAPGLVLSHKRSRPFKPYAKQELTALYGLVFVGFYKRLWYF